MAQGTPRLPRAQRRAQIIEIGNNIFALKGFNATSMEDIANEAGVSKPVLYQHFESKQELFDVLIADQFKSLSDAVYESINSTDDDALRTVNAIHAVLEYVAENPSTYGLLFNVANPDDAISKRRDAFFEEIIKLVQPFIQNHSILNDDSAHLVTMSVIHTVTTAAHLWAMHYSDFATAPIAKEPISLDEAKDIVTRQIWGGVYGFDLEQQDNNLPSADKPSA